MLTGISTRGMTVDLIKLNATFRYDGRTGRLYRGRNVVPGTEKTPGGPLQVFFDGGAVSYSRACFAIQYGYLPKQVRHRNGRVQDNRKRNLYDPSAKNEETGQPETLPHAGKYRGVSVVNCQYSQRHRGYRGSVYVEGKRHYTAVVETPELARDLRQWLAFSLGVAP